MGKGKVEHKLGNDGKVRKVGAVGSHSTVVKEAKPAQTDINNISIESTNRPDIINNIQSGENGINSEKQYRCESAEFYVHDDGWELVSETSNFRIVRHGEMKMGDNRNKRVYRYTEDLLKAGITTDENLEELVGNSTLVVIESPWFEVWTKDESEDEYYDNEDAYYTLEDAEEEAEESEKSLYRRYGDFKDMEFVSKEELNEASFKELVIGRKIVSIDEFDNITLDNGYALKVAEDRYFSRPNEISEIFLNPEFLDHVITDVVVKTKPKSKSTGDEVSRWSILSGNNRVLFFKAYVVRSDEYPSGIRLKVRKPKES